MLSICVSVRIAGKFVLLWDTIASWWLLFAYFILFLCFSPPQSCSFALWHRNCYVMWVTHLTGVEKIVMILKSRTIMSASVRNKSFYELFKHCINYSSILMGGNWVSLSSSHRVWAFTITALWLLISDRNNSKKNIGKYGWTAVYVKWCVWQQSPNVYTTYQKPDTSPTTMNV